MPTAAHWIASRSAIAVHHFTRITKERVVRFMLCVVTAGWDSSL